jgi:transposase
MSTGIIYHGFGLRRYRHVRTSYRGGGIEFTVEPAPERLRCPSCRSWRVKRRGSVPRSIRTVPIGSKPVRLALDVPRVECRTCGIVRQIHLSFAEPRKSYSRFLARYVLDLSSHMTIQDVASHVGLSWDVVKEIQKQDLQRRYGEPNLRSLRLLAIDEISIGKGHRYLTVVLDLEQGAVVFVGEGKGADALDPFWLKLKKARAKIEAVAVDLSPAYTRAVRTHLPAATIVYDHFHLVKLFNEGLSDLRRELQRNAEAEQKEVLKGTRWLLLKNSQNLDEERDERARLQEALALNADLATAYYLKEDLRRLWSQPDKAAADTFLSDWIGRAEASGVRQLRRFATTLMRHRAGILAYYDVRISTGPLEGTNNKIKTMQRQAYGFRDHEFFKLKIYALHTTRYALVG